MQVTAEATVTFAVDSLGSAVTVSVARARIGTSRPVLTSRARPSPSDTVVVDPVRGILISRGATSHLTRAAPTRAAALSPVRVSARTFRVLGESAMVPPPGSRGRPTQPPRVAGQHHLDIRPSQ